MSYRISSDIEQINNEYIDMLYHNGMRDAVIIIESRNTYIEPHTFRYNDMLETVKLPDGLIKIPNGCFARSSISEITIPESVELIDENAFADTKNLYSAEIYGTRLIVGENAFASSSIKDLLLSNGVMNICDFAFTECHNLKEVKFPASTNYIGKMAFSNCDSLENIDFSNIDNYDKARISDKAFVGCNSLQEVHITENVELTGTGIFDNCNNLSKIVIDFDKRLEGNIENIMKRLLSEQFQGCEKLNEITINTPNASFTKNVEELIHPNLGEYLNEVNEEYQSEQNEHVNEEQEISFPALDGDVIS